MATRLRTWLRKKAVSHGNSGTGSVRTQSSQDSAPPPPREVLAINYIQHVENANFGVNYGQQMMSGASNFTNTSGLRNLDSLPQHPDVSGRRSDYLEDSRYEETAYVHTWLNNSSDLVLCVHAAAGLGKSTFAHHLGEDLRSKNCLAAALFMSFIPDGWGPETIIRLIAGEIGKIHGDAVPVIASAISKFSGSSLSAQQLFDQYVIRPIQSLKLSYPLAIMADAIDEWKPHLAFLKLLSSLEPYRHIVKFIILGRTKYRATDLPGISIAEYPLPPVSKDTMVRFFNLHFAEVEWSDDGKPEGHQVSLLADKANGVFVWAFTVCSMVSDSFIDASPNQIVEQTLQSRRTVGDSEALAELYHGAITRSFPKAKERDYVRKYLQAASVLEEPLPVADFAFLIGMELRTVKRIRSGLYSLQSRIPSDAEETVYPAASIFHLSVMEYLQSKSTPPEFSFNISLFGSHAMLAEACFNCLPKLFPQHGDAPLQQFGAMAEYVVRKWPIHATAGAPRVEPDAGVEWGKTQLCIALQSLPIESLQRWEQCLRTYLASENHHSSDMGGTQEHQVAVLLHSIGNTTNGLDRIAKAAPLRIACLELAVRLRPGWALYWSDLGWAYLRQAELESSSHRGEQAMDIHRHAVRLASLNPGVDEAQIKHGLASCLGVNFDGSRDPQKLLDELSESIALHRAILELRPEGHQDRPKTLNNLGNSLRDRFLVAHILGDLDESIHLHREALKLQSETSSARPHYLHNLAYSLRRRFDVLHTLGDLKEAIRLKREALSLLSDGHTDRPDLLQNLAACLYLLFQAMSHPPDLEECIRLYRDALNSLPEDDSERAFSLYNLAVSLYEHFKSTGTRESLEESIELHQKVLNIPHEGHPGRVSSLCDIAECIRRHNEITGDLEDLEDNIELCRQELSLRPESNPACAPDHEMYRFASFLYDHYNATQAVEHLDEAIDLHRKVLTLRPKGHPDRPTSLHHLSIALWQRFKATGVIGDLEESIQRDREALELRPEGHPHRSDSLHNLAVSLREFEGVMNDSSHLQESFQLNTEALALRPEGHPERYNSLWGLGRDHYLRFQREGDVEDLRTAILLNDQSLALCPPDRSVHRETILADTILFAKAYRSLQPLAVVEEEKDSEYYGHKDTAAHPAH